MLGGTSGTTGKAYTLKNLPGADTSAYNLASTLSTQNPLAGLIPQYQDVTHNIMNNPYAASMIGGSQGSAGLGEAGALNMYGAGMNILNAGFDPQSALYNQLYQQNTDQSRANAYASGVGTSPYGVGVENQSNQNFNIGWQNNLLSRMESSAASAQPLLSDAWQQYGQASAAPYNAYNTVQQGQLGGLDALAQAYTNQWNMSQSGLQDLMSYLGMGAQYEQANVAQQQQNLNSQSANTSAVGSALGLGISLLGFL